MVNLEMLVIIVWAIGDCCDEQISLKVDGDFSLLFLHHHGNYVIGNATR
jgi:hypothetical protein